MFGLRMYLAASAASLVLSAFSLSTLGHSIERPTATLQTATDAADFVPERNAEIERAIAAVEAERTRAFMRARNAEIEVAMAIHEQQAAHRFTAARNAEIDRVLAAVEAERTRAFTLARNAEIERSVAAYDIARAAMTTASITLTGAPLLRSTD